MDITWLGHSCFRVRGKDAVVLTDPFPHGLGLPVSARRADVVTISNAHPNHSCRDSVEGAQRVLGSPGEYEVCGLSVRGVGTPLVVEGKAVWNTAFVVEMDGLLLCHLGDLAQPLSARQVEALGAPDILFVAAGGRCTLTPAQAADVVNRVAPKLAVPMHYAVPGLKVELEPLERFLQEMGLKQEEAQARLSVTRATLPTETRVVVLEPQGRS